MRGTSCVTSEGTMLIDEEKEEEDKEEEEEERNKAQTNKQENLSCSLCTD